MGKNNEKKRVQKREKKVKLDFWSKKVNITAYISSNVRSRLDEDHTPSMATYHLNTTELIKPHFVSSREQVRILFKYCPINYFYDN